MNTCSRFKLHTEKDGQKWISYPHDNGDVGDIFEIVALLNEQLNEIYELKERIEDLQNQILRLENPEGFSQFKFNES